MDPEVTGSKPVLHPNNGSVCEWLKQPPYYGGTPTSGVESSNLSVSASARMVKWLTRRSAKPILAGSNPAAGSIKGA